MPYVLDEVFARDDLQAVGEAAEVHAAAVPAYFAADAACTELVRYWGLGLEGECYAAALAAAVEFPGRVGWSG